MVEWFKDQACKMMSVAQKKKKSPAGHRGLTPLCVEC